MNEKIIYLMEYFKYLKNPISALLFKFNMKKEYNLKLKNTNLSYKLNDSFLLDRIMNRVPSVQKDKFDEFLKFIDDIVNDKEIITINEINFVNVYNSNFRNNHSQFYRVHNEEYFTDDLLDMIDAKNKNIIDIGANVVDSTLFFAKNGANVLGFEPVKHLYNMALENISLNPKLKNQIQFINKAVGGKKGTINIMADSMSGYVDNSEEYDIEVITIEDIISDYNFPIDVLKMDCEGCEFEIIKNSDLSIFNEIIFEHHSKMTGKDYKELIKKFEENNFKIRTYICNSGKTSFENQGIIYAFK